ncbi:MAG: hypothetical protein MJ072_02285, partial [Clostridia bacterium]|nr:hypothetical protein [Clostridia bacterium]
MAKFYKEFNDNDSAFKKSSQEYKNILKGLEKFCAEENKADAKDNAKALLNECNKYIENANKKTEMSDYAKIRYLSVQKLKRSLQASLTKDNLDKYLKTQKETEENEEIEGNGEEEKDENTVQTESPFSETTDEPIIDTKISETETKEEQKDERETNATETEIKEIVKEEKELEKDGENFNLLSHDEKEVKEEQKEIAKEGKDNDKENFNLLSSNENVEVEKYEPGEFMPEKTEEIVEKLDVDLKKETNELVEKQIAKERSLQNDKEQVVQEKNGNGVGIGQ